MSEFIQGFTESMARQSTVTSAYGQDLAANGSRTAAITMELNGSWRGPGYDAAAVVGDGYQTGVRPRDQRVELRALGVHEITGQYDNQIATSQSVMNSVGMFSVTA